MKRMGIFILFVLIMTSSTRAQIVISTTSDSICGHPIFRDGNGQILSWHQPEQPGAGYAHVARLASEFLLNSSPVYEPLNAKMYFITCCFQGPHMTENGGFVAEDWMHNPACVWAGLVQSLVLDYRVFSGESSYIGLVREMLDFQLEHGTTPADWPWPNVPYASADPFVLDYHGATKWENDGMRGDGLHGIEPDKIGELGFAYLKFYQVTEEARFLQAALFCADALAKYVRDVRPEARPFIAATTEKSPWPFRVNAHTGIIISEYCSNVIEPIRLFDELLRLKDRFALDPVQVEKYLKARNLAWEWLYSINGPMKTYIWNAYFEDIPNDPDRTNRLQITPLETARYLVKNPALDADIETNVPALIHWVASVFAAEGMDAIKEQTWCYEPMGSHTSRYASLCALWYGRTGHPWYKEQAYRFFNFASYMCRDNGVVSVGPKWPGSWWSDGYGDYIRHFMEGLAAVPEWCPLDQHHLLKSTSVVQDIRYSATTVAYSTFDAQSTETLRVTKQPHTIISNGHSLSMTDQETPGWTWRPLDQGGLLVIRKIEKNVKIEFD